MVLLTIPHQLQGSCHFGAFYDTKNGKCEWSVWYVRFVVERASRYPGEYLFVHSNRLRTFWQSGRCFWNAQHDETEWNRAQVEVTRILYLRNRHVSPLIDLANKKKDTEIMEHVDRILSQSSLKVNQSVRSKELLFCSFSLHLVIRIDSQTNDIGRIIETLRKLAHEEDYIHEPSVIQALQKFCVLYLISNTFHSETHHGVVLQSKSKAHLALIATNSSRSSISPTINVICCSLASRPWRVCLFVLSLTLRNFTKSLSILSTIQKSNRFLRLRRSHWWSQRGFLHLQSSRSLPDPLLSSRKRHSISRRFVSRSTQTSLSDSPQLSHSTLKTIPAAAARCSWRFFPSSSITSRSYKPIECCTMCSRDRTMTGIGCMLHCVDLIALWERGIRLTSSCFRTIRCGTTCSRQSMRSSSWGNIERKRRLRTGLFWMPRKNKSWNCTFQSRTRLAFR